MPKNVSQLTFSMHVCMCVFPSSFLQNNKLSLQLPSGNWSRIETNKGCFSFWRWPLVPHLGLQEHVFCVSYAICSHTVILRQFRLLKIFFSCCSSQFSCDNFNLQSNTQFSISDFFIHFDLRSDNRPLWHTQITRSENWTQTLKGVRMRPCDKQTHTHTHTQEFCHFFLYYAPKAIWGLFAVVMDIEIPNRFSLKSRSPLWILFEKCSAYMWVCVVLEECIIFRGRVEGESH